MMMEFNPKHLIEITLPRWLKELREIREAIQENEVDEAAFELLNTIKDMEEALTLAGEDDNERPTPIETPRPKKFDLVPKPIRVRISDNVLEDKDWTIFELEFAMAKDIPGSVGENVPKVVSQRLINEGCYGEHLLGKTIVDLVKWLAYDPTGSHPEVWHEVWDTRKARWKSMVSVIDLRQILGC